MTAATPPPAPRFRIPVPEDPRDLPGDFPHRLSVTIRFGDTDAMGHVNNSRYLTYCESARIAYWEAATGDRIGLPLAGRGEGMILAEIRITYRSPAFFREVLDVETRIGRIGRSSLVMDHRMTAPGPGGGPARLVAVAESVLVVYDYDAGRPRRIPESLVARLETYEARSLTG
jgi:acyl-CoA thioester hydrolase